MNSIAMNQIKLNRSIKTLLIVFIIGLVLSGITAFPVETELSIGNRWVRELIPESDFSKWIELAYAGIHETNVKYPFISYGTDWLAFAHLVIAVVFIGPLKDPIKNVWVVQFGMIACVAIFPLALIAGPLRGIPLYWRCIDCSFGFFGVIVLWICYRKIKQLESKQVIDSQPMLFIKPDEK